MTQIWLLICIAIQVPCFSTEVVSLILDELHNHIHSAVIDLEREHVESYLCVCVLVYIYMNLSFIVPWTKILLILYCWYFTWSMWRSTMKLVDLLLQKLPVIIWVKQSMVNLNHKISLSLFTGETVLDIVLYTSFLVNISWTLCWTGIKLGNGT